MLGFLKLPPWPSGAGPALDWPLESALPSLAAFSRASAGRYWADTGLIAAANTDTPRFDRQPGTATKRGLLLEGSRTNIARYSSGFENAAWNEDGTTNSVITADDPAVTAPDGTTTADRITDNATNGNHWRGQYVAFTSGTIYTASVYAKAGTLSKLNWRDIYAANTRVQFDLNAITATIITGTPTVRIADVGGGWRRCTVTFTSSITSSKPFDWRLVNAAGSEAYVGTGQYLWLWGAQLEAGAAASSYIPTTSSTVTRAADVASIALGGWFSASAGALLVRGEPVNAAVDATLACLDDGTANNRIRIVREAAGHVFCRVDSGGTEVAALDLGAVSGGTPFTVVLAWRENDFAASLEGGSVVADTNGTVPTGLTTLRLGTNQAGGAYLNGWIRRVEYWPVRLDDARIRSLAGGL